MVARAFINGDTPLVPAFYSGKQIFITGGTGFMGKVLIERLLSTCPDIGNLYLLMRNKRDTPPDKRLAQLKQHTVFENIRRLCPSQLDKLRVVCGDTAKPQLGLNYEALETIREVSLVFHVAATLKFDEELCKAVDENVLSTMRLMDICDGLPHIKAFVHVSTAYTMAELSVVEEKVYRPPVDPDQLTGLVSTLPSDVLASIVPKLLGDKPNTYTFTKAVAEAAVCQHQASYPIAIFRPTIVISSMRHPFPGWIENFNGPSGVVAAAGKGLMHTFRCGLGLRADLLPVDLAIDTLIAVAWHTADQKPGEPIVYNCSTSDHPTTWKHFYDALRENIYKQPFDQPVWYPCGTACENRYVYKLNEMCLQTIPLYLAEYICKLFGVKNKVNLISASQKISAMGEVLQFFSLREWHFRCENVRRLREKLSPADREIYNLDPRTIDWDEHYRNFICGTRKYLLKESDDDIDKAKKQLRRMYILHTSMKILAMLLTTRTILKYSTTARTLLSSFFKLMQFIFSNVYRRAVGYVM